MGACFKDDAPLEDEQDLEIAQCFEMTEFCSWEDFYINERSIEIAERRKLETIEIDAYEFQFLALACQNIANQWHKNCEIVVPYEGDVTPKYIKGMYSLAKKIGVRIINKYYDEDYREWLKSADRSDSYPVQWMTREQIEANSKSKLLFEEQFEENNQEESGEHFSAEQILEMIEIEGNSQGKSEEHFSAEQISEMNSILG